MITIKDLQQNDTFVYERTGELYVVQDVNAQIKCDDTGLWIPCVTYKKKEEVYSYSSQLFIRDHLNFMKNFSLPKQE